MLARRQPTSLLRNRASRAPRSPASSWYAVLGASLVAVLGCRGEAPQARAEAAALDRQVRSLRNLVEAAEAGLLFPPDRLAVGLDAALIRELLQRRLPVTTVLVEPFQLRLDSADVRFENGQSLVVLGGRVSAAGDDRSFADLRISGGLRRLEVDRDSGLLRARVDLDSVEVQRLEAGGVEREIAGVLSEGFGGRSLGALGDVLPAIEIPVRLDQRLELGGFASGPVSVGAKTLAVEVSVSRVMPLRGRLWVLLDVRAGGGGPR